MKKIKRTITHYQYTFAKIKNINDTIETVDNKIISCWGEKLTKRSINNYFNKGYTLIEQHEELVTLEVNMEDFVNLAIETKSMEDINYGE